MTRTVVLVRHAAPELVPGLGPSEWPLTPAGRAAAATVRNCLPRVATFAASAERKAIETLRAAVHADFTTDERFGEVRRPNEPISDDVRPARRAWVAGALDRRHEGWESPRAAADRFGAGLDALPGEAVVVATHGMVLTSWLVTVGVVRPGEEAAEFWSGLVLPDVIRVQLP